MKRPDKKRNNRLKQSQNQSLKMHQRMYVVVGVCSMLLTGGMIAFLHFSSSEQSMAQGDDQPQYLVMKDQVFVTDMHLASPIVRTEKAPGKNTIYMKPMVNDTIQK